MRHGSSPRDASGPTLDETRGASARSSSATDDATAAALEIRDLQIGFGGGQPIVDGVDLVLRQGTLTCMVGESGSGKSLTALALMQLLPPHATVRATGLRMAGNPLAIDALARLRGDRIAMVFQEPMTALNPVMTVADQVAEPLMRHRSLTRQQARQQVLEAFRQAQIPAAEERMNAYPHQLSGGMRQRVMIAMALACRPQVLIADEPTTALDVTIQAQILRLIDGLRVDMGTAVLMITHNLSVVAEIADEIIVMYAGRVVERGTRDQVFGDPLHPYTLALFAAIPRAEDRGGRLAAIDGHVPPLHAMPAGCRFAPRCPFAIGRCHAEPPPLSDHGAGHAAACWRAPLEEHVT
jgi:peptide/nickel transport system ATP-binding protein